MMISQKLSPNYMMKRTISKDSSTGLKILKDEYPGDLVI